MWKPQKRVCILNCVAVFLRQLHSTAVETSGFVWLASLSVIRLMTPYSQICIADKQLCAFYVQILNKCVFSFQIAMRTDSFFYMQRDLLKIHIIISTTFNYCLHLLVLLTPRNKLVSNYSRRCMNRFTGSSHPISYKLSTEQNGSYHLKSVSRLWNFCPDSSIWLQLQICIWYCYSKCVDLWAGSLQPHPSFWFSLSRCSCMCMSLLLSRGALLHEPFSLSFCFCIHRASLSFPCCHEPYPADPADVFTPVSLSLCAHKTTSSKKKIIIS